MTDELTGERRELRETRRGTERRQLERRRRRKTERKRERNSQGESTHPAYASISLCVCPVFLRVLLSFRHRCGVRAKSLVGEGPRDNRETDKSARLLVRKQKEENRTKRYTYTPMYTRMHKLYQLAMCKYVHIYTYSSDRESAKIRQRTLRHPRPCLRTVSLNLLPSAGRSSLTRRQVHELAITSK